VFNCHDSRRGKTFIKHFHSEESATGNYANSIFNAIVRHLFTSPFLSLMKVSEMYLDAKRGLLFWIKQRAMTRDTRERCNYSPRCLITKRLRNREPIIDTLFVLMNHALEHATKSCICKKKSKRVESFSFVILIFHKIILIEPLIAFVSRSRVLIIGRSRFPCEAFYTGRLALICTSDIVWTKVARNRSEIRFLLSFSLSLSSINIRVIPFLVIHTHTHTHTHTDANFWKRNILIM